MGDSLLHQQQGLCTLLHAPSFNVTRPLEIVAADAGAGAPPGVLRGWMGCREDLVDHQSLPIDADQVGHPRTVNG